VIDNTQGKRLWQDNYAQASSLSFKVGLIPPSLPAVEDAPILAAGVAGISLLCWNSPPVLRQKALSGSQNHSNL